MIILEIKQSYKNDCDIKQISIEIDNEYRVFNKILKTRKTIEAIKEEIEFALERIIADYTKDYRNTDNITYDYFITFNDDRLYQYTIYNLLEKNIRISKITRNYEDVA